MSLDPNIKTEVRFVAGFEPGRKAPWGATQLRQRFAVIQETYRRDRADMYLDEALWLRLVDFASSFLWGLTPVIIDEEHNETPRDEFLATWRSMAADRRLPEGILLRDERGATVLFIQPVYWAQVGGPMPYHDSYTYEIHSHNDIGARVMRFLADGNTRWNLSPRVLKPGEAGVP